MVAAQASVARKDMSVVTAIRNVRQCIFIHFSNWKLKKKTVHACAWWNACVGVGYYNSVSWCAQNPILGSSLLLAGITICGTE